MDPEQTFIRVQERFSQMLTPRIRASLEYIYLFLAITLFCILVVMHANFVQQVLISCSIYQNHNFFFLGYPNRFFTKHLAQRGPIHVEIVYTYLVICLKGVELVYTYRSSWCNNCHLYIWHDDDQHYDFWYTQL